MLFAREPKRNKGINDHILALEAHPEQYACAQRHTIPTSKGTYHEQNLAEYHCAHNYEHHAMNSEHLVIDQEASCEATNDIWKCIKRIETIVLDVVDVEDL